MSRAPLAVVFSVGAASILVGAVTGGLSLSITGDLQASCAAGICPPNERGRLDSANALANVSTATFVIGGLAAAAGVVLIAVSPGKPKTGAAVTVEPWVSAGGAGLRGRF
jgi:hypothetical protein